MPRTLTIGCKVPQGLRLRVFDMKASRDTGVSIAVPVDRGFVLSGAPLRSDGTNVWFTPGVDADLFNAWLAQNAESDLVKDGLVFVHSTDEA